MHRADLLGRTSGDVAGGTIVYALGTGLVTVLVLVAAFGLALVLTPGGARLARAPMPAAPRAAADAVQSMLDALLVPALDGDAMPLRWADPRARSHCGPNTAVRVNRQALVAGALVPVVPFELEWLIDGCRPFGEDGPRFDGRVRLTVFREDWGYSAMVDPTSLRVTSADSVITCTQPGAAWLPKTVTPDEPFVPTAAGASLPCR